MTWGCSQCGGDNPDGTRFCGHCGRPASAADSVIGRLAQGQVPVTIGGPATDQRRLVTALFADVSGFSSWADGLDPESLSDSIGRIIAALSEVVGRHDGYVDKYSGDALLAFFGAPVAHDDDAVRAVSVASEMHTQLERIKATLPAAAAHLQLHIGINTGHAIARVIGSEVRNDYSVLGDAINVAQRLEAAASPGETFVGALTERLTRASYEYEFVGPLELKGKTEPVDAWRVVGERAAVVSAGPERDLVGRARELAVLSRRLDATAASLGSVVVISGEPGAGKTMLLAAARRHAQSLGLTWLEARAISYGNASPYEPLRTLLATVPIEDAELVGERDALLRLLSASSGDEQWVGPEARRRRVHRAVARILRRAAARNPLVFAFDDVHWADAASQALMVGLAVELADAPITFLVTARVEGNFAERLQSAVLDAVRIELTTLDPAATGALVRHHGARLSEAQLESIVHRSGGNPFFAVELATAMAQETSAVPDAALPATIEGVVSARIDRCGPDASRVLEVASVIGTEVPAALLAACVELEIDSERAVKDLVDVGVLCPHPTRPGVMMFVHALVQEIAYGRILRRRSHAIHLDVANALERESPASGELADVIALHLYRARAGRRAVRALVRAADRAEAIWANESAVLHLQRAIEVIEAELDGAGTTFGAASAPQPDDSPDYERVAFRLGHLLRRTGAFRAAATVFTDLLARHGAIAAACGLAAALRSSGDVAAALDVVARAQAAASTDAERGSLLFQRGRCEMFADSFPAAIETLRTALDLVESPRERADVLIDLANAEAAVEDLDRALVHALAARDTCEAADDQRQLASALRVLGGVYEDSGRLDEAARTLRDGLEIAERVGHVEEIAGCLVNLGLVELSLGFVAQAIATDRRAIEELARIDHSALPTAYANLAEALLASGELTDARDYCGRAIDLAERRNDALTTADAGLTLARVELASGNWPAAAAMAERAALRFAELGTHDWTNRAAAVAAEARLAQLQSGADPA